MPGSYRTNPNTGYTIGRYLRESRGRTSRRQVSLQSGIPEYRLRQYETDARLIDPDDLWTLVIVLAMAPAEAFRCARYPGAFQLPEDLQTRPHAMTEAQREQILTYLDIITGRDPTEHGNQIA